MASGGLPDQRLARAAAKRASLVSSPRDTHRLGDLVGLIVEQDPARRRLDIVKLSRPYRPDERGDRAACDEEGEWEHDVERGHEATSLVANARERNELASTVSELAGISSAAIKGWITPAAARLPAIRL